MIASFAAVIGMALSVTSPVAADDAPNPIVTAVKEKLKHPDKPFTMLVLLKVKAGKEKEFEEAFAAALKETRKEKGCIAYDLNRDVEQEGSYAVYERWKNLAAMEEHAKAKYITKLLETMGPLLDGAPQIKVGIPAGE